MFREVPNDTILAFKALDRRMGTLLKLA